MFRPNTRDDAVGVVDHDGRLYGCVSAWDLKFLNHHRLLLLNQLFLFSSSSEIIFSKHVV